IYLPGQAGSAYAQTASNISWDEAEMKRLVFGFWAGFLLIGPAWADEWSTYYNMATFGAGGGADDGGWMNFECAGSDSGFSTAGQPYFNLRIGQGFSRKKLTLEETITFFVDDG